MANMSRLILAAVGGGGIRSGVHLTDANINSSGGGALQRVYIRFNTDGTVDRRIGDTYTQINELTDWIIPNTDANSSYEVGHSARTGDTFNAANAAGIDGYVHLGTDRQWGISATNADRETVATFHIRNVATSAVLATATFTFTITSV